MSIFKMAEKNIYKAAIAALLLCLAFFIVIHISRTDQAMGGATDNISGWAWSDTTGWISFNCTNPGTCAAFDYGVSIDSATGDFSGYAWSDAVGWISFNAADTAGCPSGVCQANLAADNTVSGWAKALSADGISWDGWIKLSDATAPAYGVTLNPATNEFEGFAWGSDVMGWLSFNDNYGGFPGPFDYQVVYSPPPPVLTDLYIDEFADTVCGYTSGAQARFNWNFSDAGDTQSAYQIQIDDDLNFGSPIDTGKIFSSSNSFISSPPNLLLWGTAYYWRVRAWDSLNATSSCGNLDGWCYPPSPSGSPTAAPGISTSTPAYSYPYVDFAPKPQTPSVGEVTTFIQDDIAVARSLCYNGGEHLCQNDASTTYEWDFSYESIAGFITEGTFKGNAATTYAVAGDYTAGLRVTDNSLIPAGTCGAFSFLKVGIPLPEWKEIPPFQ